MPALDDIHPAEAAALLDVVTRLKHDLGKYVALQVRWLGDDVEPQERVAALRADLLSTRRGPDGSRPATAVWADFAPLLSEALAGDPDLEVLVASMRELEHVIDLLVVDPVQDETIDTGFGAALRVSEACRSLARRVRGRAEG